MFPVGETSLMSALVIRCQDKITEALYPIEQLITEAKVGQPGQTGGERTATPLCSAQGSTLAPSLCRERSRRKLRTSLTADYLKRLRTSTTVQTRHRTSTMSNSPCLNTPGGMDLKRPAWLADTAHAASRMQCASEVAELEDPVEIHK